MLMYPLHITKDEGFFGCTNFAKYAFWRERSVLASIKSGESTDLFPWILVMGSLDTMRQGKNSPSSSSGTLKPDSNAKYLPDSSDLSCALSMGTQMPDRRVLVSTRGYAK